MCAIMEVSLTRKEQTTMTSIYDYEKNINITTTPNGDKVITMNEAIFDVILNRVFDSYMLDDENGNKATAEDTLKLWSTLNKKERASNIDK